MTESGLPLELMPTPGSNLVRVPVSPETERSMNPERMANACAQLGLIRLTPTILRTHQILGEELEAAGAIKFARSGSFVGQQIMLEILKKLDADMDKSEDTDTRVKIAETMGYVSGKLAEQSKAMLASSPAASKELHNASPQRQSFPPLAVLSQNTTINHGSKDSQST